MSGGQLPWWRRGGRSLRDAARSGSQRFQRVVSQGKETARNAGRSLARHVIAVQKAAKLEPRLMAKSAASVVMAPDDPARPSDANWRAGYREVAVPAVEQYAETVAAERAPTSWAPPREPEGAPAARPTWPHVNPADRDDPSPEGGS